MAESNSVARASSVHIVPVGALKLPRHPFSSHDAATISAVAAFSPYDAWCEAIQQMLDPAALLSRLHKLETRGQDE